MKTPSNKIHCSGTKEAFKIIAYRARVEQETAEKIAEFFDCLKKNCTCESNMIALKIRSGVW